MASLSNHLSVLYRRRDNLEEALKWAVKYEAIRAQQLQVARQTSVGKVPVVYEQNHALAALNLGMVHGKLGNFQKANVLKVV